MKELKHFRLSEFDSPDLPGSGVNMRYVFLAKLDQAREIAGAPFIITKGGGYRTPEYNEDLVKRNPKASPTSSHLKGLAADIAARGSAQRFAIVQALLDVGITRIGIAKTFVHCDLDETKPPELIWVY